MTEEDFLALLRYTQEHIPEPDITMSPEIFETQAYAQWAGKEVLERAYAELARLPEHVSGNSSQSMKEIVEEFVDEMETYSQKATDDRAKNMFTVARDEGRCMLLYISHERKN